MSGLSEVLPGCWGRPMRNERRASKNVADDLVETECERLLNSQSMPVMGEVERNG
ncbi:hypothetical protein ETAA8_08850 [Anatilimnocola aggregata]|uniref:Uncharacterized protein n=1 Tax=Anatilimnocola aggregata TaxID=2528021 RepID=A0A517Y6F4_9BACT|nr:hypothetical protein ETAA8_08850 [Anatilimnocola aggregata]